MKIEKTGVFIGQRIPNGRILNIDFLLKNFHPILNLVFSPGDGKFVHPVHQFANSSPASEKNEIG
ncbi:hypothetical protein IEQ34_024691 [Dendrobium chrysotoxum]|uniref:Uncharacterized protein n=1 Tax=Dendrobium chrysotoxum TaxID=161865 RepID=A0AAV7FRV2_DENCH|nr:hypothetical protein IEQ34_024691 [Dendrobium chrysotoxum]